MKTISKVVGDFRVWACQIQNNLVSCTAHYDNPFNSKNDFEEVIFKTNNVELALNKYIKMIEKETFKL